MDGRIRRRIWGLEWGLLFEQSLEAQRTPQQTKRRKLFALHEQKKSTGFHWEPKKKPRNNWDHKWDHDWDHKQQQTIWSSLAVGKGSTNFRQSGSRNDPSS